MLRRFTLSLLVASLLGVAVFPRVSSADEPASADAKKDAGNKQEKKDPFKVPEGGVKELLAFIKGLSTMRPKTQDEAVEFSKRRLPALKEAAEKVQELATPADRKLEGYDDAIGMLLLIRASELARKADPEATQKLIADIKENIKSSETPSNYAVSAIMQLASAYEYGPPAQRQKAVDIYKEFGPMLAESKDEQVARSGQRMEGAARRLSLPGNQMRVEGTLMDGGKFDWAKYRGKVVLVDFWATWCGPCIAELPNVKKNYELYHDKGFDVVAISLDQDRDALEKFLAKEQNPWVTLHDGADNSTANYYGIMGIPTVILVDKEGTVVNTNARGPVLTKELEKLLGPPEPKEKDADAGKGEKP